MRKAFFISLVALFAVACTGPQGPRGQDGLVNFKVIELDVTNRTWGYSETSDNNYFIASYDMPEITKDIYENGVVQVYRRLYDDKGNETSQQLLPMTRHNEYFITDNKVIDGKTYTNTTAGFYTETVDYEYGIGFLNIFYTASDFDYEVDTQFVPDNMNFRVVIMW